METLRIEKTDDSPSIIMDPVTGIFEITGKSLPEDVVAFYQPVISWIEEYSKVAKDFTEVTFRLVYFNTASVITSYSIHYTKLYDGRGGCG